MKRITNFLSKSFSRNQLLGGSLVMFAGTMFGNFCAYLYHLIIGRMLGPEDYSVLSSVLSLTYFYGIPISVLNIVSVKYISSLKEEKGLSAVSGFYHWLQKKLIIFGLVVFLFLLFISPLIKNFLNLDSEIPIILVCLGSLFGVYSNLNLAILQGLLRFFRISFLTVLTSVIKLLVSITLVAAGLKVFGAVLVFPINAIILLYLSSWSVKKFLLNPSRNPSFSKKEVFRYSLPVLFFTIAFSSLYTSDVLLVKHFFSSREAGLYAALAVLGKVIFFASSSVGAVMFPIVSGKAAKGENYRPVLLISLLLVAGICGLVNLIYFLFPDFMITVLYGNKYLEAGRNLGLFSVFISFYSLSSLLASFYLAISKTKMVNCALVATVLQVVLIWFFHNSLRQVIIVNIVSLSFLLISLLIPLFGQKSVEVGASSG